MHICMTMGCLRLKRATHGGRVLQRAPEPYEGMFFQLETHSEERSAESYVDAQGRNVQVSYTQAYDHVAQILHLTGYKRWREGEKEQTEITRTALRYTFPQELAALLHAAWLCHHPPIWRLELRAADRGQPEHYRGVPAAEGLAPGRPAADRWTSQAAASSATNVG